MRNVLFMTVQTWANSNDDARFFGRATLLVRPIGFPKNRRVVQ